MKRSMLSAAILGILGLSSTFTALAVNTQVTLCAGQFDKELSGPTDTVPMWGYSLSTDADPTGCAGPFSSPGPRIKVADTDTGLDITLNNTLSRPTSLVIPGTIKGMVPETFIAPDGTTRMRSFDVEAAAQVGAIVGSVSYSWNDLPSGSYLYHSGTHSQVQVQMGLFGAATHDTPAGEAYPGKPYSQEIILFYTEIDRAIHDSVTDISLYPEGNYNETDMKSTVDYDPKYFFINVSNNAPNFVDASYTADGIQAIKISAGSNLLVRFYNAGLQTHVPTVFEADFDVFAEDGKLSPFVRNQYTMTLPPLKTKDAYLNVLGSIDDSTGASLHGSFRLTDSAMAVSNPSGVHGAIDLLADGKEISNGDGNGMVMDFVIEPPDGYVAPVPSDNHPKAIRDSMSVAEEDAIADIMTAATNNDVNVAGTTVSILSYPKNGELTDNGGGDFNYQHDGGEDNRDSIIYSITNSAGESSTASILIDVIPTNDAPVANDDTVTAKVGQKIEIRALNNDTDVDSPRLRISSVDASGLGSLIVMDKVIIFEPTTEGSEDISYTISDQLNATSTAQLHLTVSAATAGTGIYTSGVGTGGGSTAPTGTAPVAIAKSYSVMEGSVLDIAGNSILGVMGTSVGAKASTGLLEYPEHGAIQMFEDGTFVYTHNGDDEEDDHFVFEIYNDYGTSSATATITIVPKMNPPRVNNDRAKTSAGSAVLIDLLRNDKDTDSALDPKGIVLLASEMPQHGTVEIMTEGHVKYSPAAGFTGVDYFRYQLKDVHTGELSSRSAKVIISVN